MTKKKQKHRSGRVPLVKQWMDKKKFNLNLAIRQQQQLRLLFFQEVVVWQLLAQRILRNEQLYMCEIQALFEIKRALAYSFAVSILS